MLHCKKEERVGFSSGVFVSGDGGGNPEDWNLGLNLAAQILQRWKLAGLVLSTWVGEAAAQKAAVGCVDIPVMLLLMSALHRFSLSHH